MATDKKLYQFFAFASTRAVFRASSIEEAEEAWDKFLEKESPEWQENDDSGEEVDMDNLPVAKENIIEV